MNDSRRGGIRWLAALCAAAAFGAGASVPEVSECLEGGDFIGNAAHARDNGIARSEFLDRMTADFAAIRSYPPDLRWFVKDDDDERFLLAAAADVFDSPVAPDRHRTSFVRACLSRATA